VNIQKTLWVAWEKDASIRSRILAKEMKADYYTFTAFEGRKYFASIRYIVAVIQTLLILLKMKPIILVVQNPSIVLCFLSSITINADILFRTTSENPFIYWEGIDNLIQNHIEGNFDLSFYGTLPLGASYEIINLKSLEFSHRHGTKKHRSEYSTLYIYENPKKFKINRIEPEKSLQRPDFRLTVDTPQDLWVVRIIHDSVGNNDKPIKLEKIIHFLDIHKEVPKINSNIVLKYNKYLK